MIGKIRKGRSFGGCIRYVTQKDDAEIIASEGVLLGTAEANFAISYFSLYYKYYCFPIFCLPSSAFNC